jgi:hypothetical protein
MNMPSRSIPWVVFLRLSLQVHYPARETMRRLAFSYHPRGRAILFRELDELPYFPDGNPQIDTELNTLEPPSKLPGRKVDQRKSQIVSHFIQSRRISGIAPCILE